MKNKKPLAVVCFLAFLLAILSACGSSSSVNSNASSNNQSHAKKSSAIEPSKTKHSSSSNSQGSSSSSPNNGNKNKAKSNGGKAKISNSNNSDPTGNPSKSSNPNNKNLIDARTNAVVLATLKYESKQPNTSVNYQSYTMTQSGKKVGFSIVPNANHQNDFKEGVIKEVIPNGNNSHDVTLFEYKFADHKLSLIDTANLKVVYTEPFNK